MPEDTTQGQEQQALADQSATPKLPLLGPIPTPPEPIASEPILPELEFSKGPITKIPHGGCATFAPRSLMLQGVPNGAYLVGPACGHGVRFHLDNLGNGHWTSPPVPEGGVIRVTNNSNGELRVRLG
jgi:hypothetical protein